MATKTATAVKTKINLGEIEEGDIFSEQSHYIFEGKKPGTNQYQFTHLESGNKVSLGDSYVGNLLQTADQYNETVEVGIEDKKWTAKQIADEFGSTTVNPTTPRVGDVRQKGILSIWNDIHSQQVFTVNFNKANKELSDKALGEAMAKQGTEALNKIAQAAKNKKGVAAVAAEVIRHLQENPILPIEKGDERTLRGYKTQFVLCRY